MGRWSQYRHRGRGIPPSAGGLGPPADADWAVSSPSGGEVDAALLIAWPDTVGGMMLVCNDGSDPGTDPNSWAAPDIVDVIGNPAPWSGQSIFFDPGATGDTGYCRACWLDGSFVPIPGTVSDLKTQLIS